MRRHLFAIAILIGAGLGMIAGIPSWATDDDPIEVVAEAPVFVDPTCTHGDDFILPHVEGLDYRYEADFDVPKGDPPRTFVTVEPLDGYTIKAFEGDYDHGFDHGFDAPIAPGAWVHTFKPEPRDCDPDRGPDSKAGPFPNTGG